MNIELKATEGQEELPIEILVEHIVKLADIGRRMKNSRLKQRTISLLLKDSTGINVSEINKILDALAYLESRYLKK